MQRSLLLYTTQPAQLLLFTLIISKWKNPRIKLGIMPFQDVFFFFTRALDTFGPSTLSSYGVSNKLFITSSGTATQLPQHCQTRWTV